MNASIKHEKENQSPKSESDEDQLLMTQWQLIEESTVKKRKLEETQ